MVKPGHLTNTLSACAEVRDITGRLHGLLGAVDAAVAFDSASYTPQHFRPAELVCPEVYSVYGARALMFMDSRILWTADAIREHFGRPVVINTWQWREVGGHCYRGLRPWSSQIGAAMSQHKYGRALDFDVDGMPAAEVRAEIRDRWRDVPAFRFITALEDGVDWVHIDCRNTGSEELMVFRAE